MNQDTYLIDDLPRLLEGDCNLIAYACTTLQAQGIDAFLSYLQQSGVPVKGYILLLSHPLTGRLITPADFTTTADVEFVNGGKSFSYRRNPVMVLSERLRYRVKPGKKVYIVCTEVVDAVVAELTRHGFDCYSVVVDDGGGSYQDKLQFKIEDVRYLNHRASVPKQLALIARAVVEYASEEVMLRRIRKHERLIDFRIFKGEGSHLERNALAASFYEEEFRKHATTTGLRDTEAFEDAYLINTQCFAENKMTDGIVDLKMYAAVTKLIQSIGGKIVLKPHPRELNLEKYKTLGLNVYSNNTYPQEVIIAGLDRKPKCIISVFSSTLLNAHGLFGIPAVSLAKLMLKENISSVFAGQLKAFIKQYRNVFIFPESYEELEEILRSYAHHNEEQG